MNDASTTASTETLLQQSTHPDLPHPTIPEIVTLNAPTNMEILSDLNLSHAHIAEINTAINNFRLPSQSTTTQKACTELVDPLVIAPSNLGQIVSPDLQVHDNFLGDAPVAHVLDIKGKLGSKKLLDLTRGTWKRLGPTKHISTEKETILPCAGPKCKLEEMVIPNDMSVDKKQKLAEEESAMAWTIPDNMGSALTAWQHHRVQ